MEKEIFNIDDIPEGYALIVLYLADWPNSESIIFISKEGNGRSEMSNAEIQLLLSDDPWLEKLDPKKIPEPSSWKHNDSIIKRGVSSFIRNKNRSYGFFRNFGMGHGGFDIGIVCLEKELRLEK